MPDDSSKKKKPDRPLECTECKKPVAITYTEIVGNKITHTSMCSSCPQLQKRLHGEKLVEHVAGPAEIQGSITCGNCGTPLTAIRSGAHLGCSVCYEVFDETLQHELVTAQKIPTRIFSRKKPKTFHMGRGPGEAPEINPSLRLLALNEALNDTLKREDYEQAALLRDEIKALTEKQEGDDEKKK